MKRPFIILITFLVLCVALPRLAFESWLRAQPSETQVALQGFSAWEFWVAVRDEFFPRPIDDNAAYGRRVYPGRGHSPWVMRSSLDGRPRMLSLALAPEIWISYSTETASPHQFWKGEINFSGPAFDARHGFEPMSLGLAFSQPDSDTAWRIGAREPAIAWQAYGVEPETERAWLRYALSDAAGRSWIVTERPEILRRLDPNAQSGKSERGQQVGLERLFDVARAGSASASGSGEGEGLRLRLQAASENEVAGVGRLEGDRLQLVEGRTRFVQWFAEPKIPVGQGDVDGEGNSLVSDAFAKHDCASCHHAEARTVGPAWGEVAARYAAANEAATVMQLATRIREGSVGQWGDVPMPPHATLSRGEAARLARLILASEGVAGAGGAQTVRARAAAGEIPVAITFETESDEPPETLHPALRSTKIEAAGFTPQVGGLAWLPDGRLGISTWDQDGAVFAVDGWDGPTESMRIKRIAEGLHEPLGIAVIENAVYVIQKQEITQLIDRDGDDWIDEYLNIANDWPVTSNFHEFGFGLVAKDGDLYAALSVCVLRGGKSCPIQTASRGRLFRVDPEIGEVKFLASGFRTPNGVAMAPDGEIYVTDNQGDWLPASKLMRVRAGDDFGWRRPGETPDPKEVTAPVLWLPQNEVGNSPTQPLFLTKGPYAGSVLFGDIFNGGLKRGFLEEVEGRVQGAAFHFSGGLGAPVHRLIEAPDGSVIAGEIGSRGNWGEFDKPWYGIERLEFEDEPAFEPLRVEIRPDGFDIVLSRALAQGMDLVPADVLIKDWYYVPTAEYGGPKYDLRTLPIQSVRVSEDRHRLSVDVEGLRAGRVVYLRLDDRIRSAKGEGLWVNEAWYTVNALPSPSPAALATPTAPAALAAPAVPVRQVAEVGASPPNTLSQAERAAGWRLLFDGEGFDGWKIYGAEDRAAGESPEGWVIEDGAFKFTRDVSLFGLVLNHLNPFTTAALDLMTVEKFSDFEFSIDWKISPGGNSGIFYLVREEEAAPLSWGFGVEMQVLDDAVHSDGQIEMHRAGDLYDLRGRSVDSTRPVGEWNRARIVVRGNHLEHWLNGEKLLEIERGSEEWDRAIAASKFSDVEGYGLATEGHISLQDHGDIVWYRDIKIRTLRAEAP